MSKGKTGKKKTVFIDAGQIDSIIDRYRGKKNSLVQILLEIQQENHWLPHEVLERISERLDVPLSRIKQIVTFHKTFSLMPKGRHEVHVCTGPSCAVRDSFSLLDTIENQIGIRPGETDANLKFSLEKGNCLGSCNLGPEIIVDGQHHGRVKPDSVKDVLKSYK